MRIPTSNVERFVRTLVDQCLTSQIERIERGKFFKNYALYGSENSDSAALYNKTFAYIDDLESLLYSPVSLRFHIGNPDYPNVAEEAKGRTAAAKLRNLCRQSDTDSAISSAVWWGLVKGKAFIKQLWKDDAFSPELIQPDAMGVMNEGHGRLDKNMEAFSHSMLITMYQFERLIADHPDAAALRKKAQRYVKLSNDSLSPTAAQKQVIVGGLYPFQPAGSPQPNKTRGIVDWMGGPSPNLDPMVLNSMLRLDELWVWDDVRNDWATFQIIGDDMLIMGKQARINAFAYNPDTALSDPHLKGEHPFIEVCPNPIDGYFWGRSEIANVALLQEAINSRINGINRILRIQEDPPKHFRMSTGVNQLAVSRFNKPGGYWADNTPNAEIKNILPELPGDLAAWVHELERMFDEMGGLPPIAKGRGEAGVRGQGHAETLIRMFSPRFKDRALLVERDVERLGALMLEMAKAHIAKRLIAWMPQQEAGAEAEPPRDLLHPPAPGMVAVPFHFADLDDDCTLTIDAHSSSPAFSAESKALAFDLFKIGAMSAEDVIEHVDAPDPEALVAGTQRREIARAAAAQQAEQQKLALHQGGKK